MNPGLPVWCKYVELLTGSWRRTSGLHVSFQLQMFSQWDSVVWTWTSASVLICKLLQHAWLTHLWHVLLKLKKKACLDTMSFHLESCLIWCFPSVFWKSPLVCGSPARFWCPSFIAINTSIVLFRAPEWVSVVSVNFYFEMSLSFLKTMMMFSLVLDHLWSFRATVMSQCINMATQWRLNPH